MSARGHSDGDAPFRRKRSYLPGWVYFIAMPKIRLMKVGYATNPKQRCSVLQTGSPFDLTLEDMFVGTKADEKALHRYLEPYRYNREWFRDKNDAIYDFTTEIGEWRLDAWLEHQIKSGDTETELHLFPISQFALDLEGSITDA